MHSQMKEIKRVTGVNKVEPEWLLYDEHNSKYALFKICLIIHKLGLDIVKIVSSFMTCLSIEYISNRVYIFFIYSYVYF